MFFFSPTSDMTNATFESSFCSSLSMQTTAVTSVVITKLSGIRFTLPECFWTYTTQSTSTTMSNMIIVGSSTGVTSPGVGSADPWLRFSAGTTSFSMSNVAFVDHTGAPYNSDLNAFAAYYTLLRSWICSECTLDGTKLFDSAPPKLSYVSILSSGLAGSLSNSLFSNIGSGSVSLSYTLSGNQLNGSIPASLLANIPASASLQSVLLDVSENRLSGILPPLLRNTSLSLVGTLTLQFGGNQLSGSLPSKFFSSSRISSLSLNISSNALSGEMPVDFGAMDACPSVMFFHASHNAFTGTVPPFFNNINNCPANISDVYLSLSYNRLSAIAPKFFPNSTVAPEANFAVDLSNNQIGGSIDNFECSTLSSTVRINLSFNNLTNGDGGLAPLSIFALDSPAFQTTTVTLEITNNAFRGPLAFAGLSKTQQTKLRSVINGGGFSLFASDNAFTSVVIDDSWSNSIAALDISRNPSLSGGGLPDSLFNSSSFLRLLYAAGTALSGEFPDVASLGSTRLVYVDFSDNSGIDFCSENRTAWTRSLVVCLLEHTNAASCSELYPTSCTISAPLPSLAPPPEKSTPEIPVESPAATPIDDGPSTTPSNGPVPVDAVPTGGPSSIPNGVPSAPAPTSEASLAFVSAMTVMFVIVSAASV